VLDPRYQAVAEGKERYTNKDRGDQRGCLGCLIISLVLVCPILSVFVVTQLMQTWADWAELSATAQEVQGTVRDRRIDDSGDSSAYFLTYCFDATPPNGAPQEYCKEQAVGGRVYHDAERGAPISVWYAASDPTIHQISPPNIWVPIVLSILVVAGIFFGFRWLLHAIGRVRHGMSFQKRLSAPDAQLLRGTITAISGEDDEGTYRVKLTYAFRTPTGRTLSVSPQFVRDDLAPTSEQPQKLPPVGTPVVVIYADDTTFHVL
jgi:hypothetical protein